MVVPSQQTETPEFKACVRDTSNQIQRRLGIILSTEGC